MNYFDCHADTLMDMSYPEETLWKNRRDLDLARTKSFAEKYTQIFAIWKDAKDMEASFQRLYQKAASILQSASDHLSWCRTADDMQKAHQQGKAAAFLAIEDASIMGEEVYRIRELGIRFAMLTWNYENPYACGSAVSQKKGLTSQGKDLVKFFQTQGIILDISHLSDQGAEDLFSLTDAPVIASHSNVREICGHSRNLKKEHIQELIRRKGLIGMNFYAPFVGENPSIHSLIRHMDRILEMGGEDVLAIGSDFDGSQGNFPRGISGVQSIPDLQAAMEKEGFSRKLLEKIFFGNASRFVLENVK